MLILCFLENNNYFLLNSIEIKYCYKKYENVGMSTDKKIIINNTEQNFNQESLSMKEIRQLVYSKLGYGNDALANREQTLGVVLHYVNKWFYIFLAILLGFCGIHKFYAGYKKLGFLYLLFFWTGIPFFLAFLSAVITLFKRADCFGNVKV